MEKLGVYIITLRAGLVLTHFYVLISPGSCVVILSDSFEHTNKKPEGVMSILHKKISVEGM